MKNRSRKVYCVLILITMILGLASRRFGEYLPEVLKEYSGDALWALLVFFGFSFLFNKLAGWKIALLSLIFSFGIEASQLYQEEWINSIRNTTLGGLVLGHGFLYTDLVCYTFGILMGLIIDFPLTKARKTKSGRRRKKGCRHEKRKR